jgi:membrane protein DedA with SNARE-associated domain
LEQYGYFGLFGLLMLGIIGLPLPDETLLAIVGALIKEGTMHFWPALIAAYLGSVMGISVSYLIGKFLGREVVTRFGKFFHLTEEKLLRVEVYMERYGRLTLFFGYFVPGLRQISAIVAGFGQMKFRIFAPYAYIGALVWALTFLLLGQVLHKHLRHLEYIVYPFRYWICVLVVLSLVLPFVWRMIQKRRAPK